MSSSAVHPFLFSVLSTARGGLTGKDIDPDRDLEQPEVPLKKQRKDNMAKGMTTERTGSSSSDSGTPNKELNTLENSKETNKEL